MRAALKSELQPMRAASGAAISSTLAMTPRRLPEMVRQDDLPAWPQHPGELGQGINVGRKNSALRRDRLIDPQRTSGLATSNSKPAPIDALSWPDTMPCWGLTVHRR